MCQHCWMVDADRARSRTFVVTGAASGIGLATARRLLAEGGSVVGADLASPPDLGPDFRFVTADVSDEAAIAAVMAAVPDRLDGVFHAAGVAGGGPVHLLDRAEWDRVLGRPDPRARVASEHCRRQGRQS